MNFFFFLTKRLGVIYSVTKEPINPLIRDEKEKKQSYHFDLCFLRFAKLCRNFQWRNSSQEAMKLYYFFLFANQGLFGSRANHLYLFKSRLSNSRCEKRLIPSARFRLATNTVQPITIHVSNIRIPTLLDEAKYFLFGKMSAKFQ